MGLLGPGGVRTELMRVSMRVCVCAAFGLGRSMSLPGSRQLLREVRSMGQWVSVGIDTLVSRVVGRMIGCQWLTVGSPASWRSQMLEGGPGGWVFLGGKAHLESMIALWGISVGATGRIRSTSRMVASSRTRRFRSLMVGVRLKPIFWSMSSWILFFN